MKQNLTADKIATEKQVKTMLREIGREKEMALQSRKHLKFVTDYFLIAVAYNTGLRISEVSALDWRDISDYYLIVRHGKGDKRRTVYFGNNTKQLLTEFASIQKEYFKRKCLPSDPIFLGQRGRMSSSAIHCRFKYWVRRCGLPTSLSFHSLRHGFATRLLDAAIPLTCVRDQLGHSNIAVTSVYLHFSTEARERLQKLL